MNSKEDLLTIGKKYKKTIFKWLYNSSNCLNKTLKQYKTHELNSIKLLTIEKPLELCFILKTGFFEFENIINNPIYNNYKIAKKNGGQRDISAPSNNIKIIQKRLNYYLQAYYLCVKPAEVHGFIINPNYLGQKCNIVENAKPHSNKNHILNIDLKDFFPSITAKQVYEILVSKYFNFNLQIAKAITLLTTYNGKLPIGAPTSPVLSNYVCLTLDNLLTEYCKNNNLTYTRYADDLTFSSDFKITIENINDIKNIIKSNKFEINNKKLRLKSANCCQTVTGLTVNNKVNIKRALLKKIRAMLHDLSTNGIEIATKKHFKIKNGINQHHKTKFVNRLRGYINFIGQVRGKEDILYLKQKGIFDNLKLKLN